MKSFDRKFGSEFIAGTPSCPGVYRVFDGSGTLVYVGKAKNLRRRLGQYRNANRRKKHLKMREIIKSAERIELEPCAAEIDALLRETELIQKFRPRLNVAGAFSFLYPMIGVRAEAGASFLCYTTSPGGVTGFRFHGAYRSRHVAGDAFGSLAKLLSYIGHPLPRRTCGTARFSRVVGFRQLPGRWIASLECFWRGESRDAIEELVIALADSARARRDRDEIQAHLDNLKRFWIHEALPLAKARQATGYGAYPVPQEERDFVFLKYRNSKTG